MSKFLAPIHFWLFNKVKIHEGLERDIELRFKEKFGESVTNIVNKNIDKYGNRISDNNLEDVIDEGNIHGWLQSNISIAETRQASILSDLFNEFGEEAFSFAKEVFKENAIKNAKVAREETDSDSPETIFNTINNYVLDGMPCDNASSVFESTSDCLKASSNSCLHINYWQKAGVDVDKMYELRFLWIKSFVKELNPLFEYSVDVDEKNNQRSFLYTIKRK